MQYLLFAVVAACVVVIIINDITTALYLIDLCALSSVCCVSSEVKNLTSNTPTFDFTPNGGTNNISN